MAFCISGAKQYRQQRAAFLTGLCICRQHCAVNRINVGKIIRCLRLPQFAVRQYDLKQHPNYRYTAEADKKKNAFSLERLICRRIKKLNPNEQYTVYEADVPDETPIDEDEDILNYDDLDDPDAFV